MPASEASWTKEGIAQVNEFSECGSSSPDNRWWNTLPTTLGSILPHSSSSNPGGMPPMRRDSGHPPARRETLSGLTRLAALMIPDFRFLALRDAKSVCE